MKVVAFNGSARKEGNTQALISIVAGELEAEGIETRIVSLAGMNLNGCIACYKCLENKDERCVQKGDDLNDYIQMMKAADGIILGSPTYFADVSTNMKALIERAGFVGRTNGNLYRRKVGAPVVAARRAGAVATFSSLMYFFHIGQMITPGSSYWNLGYGLKPGEVSADTEGVETMRTLGANMAWLIGKISG